MEIYNFSNFNKVFVVGDMHGEFNTLLHRIKQNSTPLSFASVQKGSFLDRFRKALHNDQCKLNDSIIVVSGNCHFGFNNEEYYIKKCNEINEYLKTINSYLFFIRGNHDDPNYFNGKVISFSNVKAIPDYSIISTANDNILCIGGAVSIDRTWRIAQEALINKHNNAKKLYWKDEAPIYNSEELNNLVKNDIDITYVISHTVPSFVSTTLQEGEDGWYAVDEHLKDDLIAERNIMDKIYVHLLENGMSLKEWYYGHFRNNAVFVSHDNILFNGLQDDMTFIDVLEDHKGDLPNKKSLLGLNNHIFAHREPMHFDMPHFDPIGLHQVAPHEARIEDIHEDTIDDGALEEAMADFLHNHRDNGIRHNLEEDRVMADPNRELAEILGEAQYDDTAVLARADIAENNAELAIAADIQ